MSSLALALALAAPLSLVLGLLGIGWAPPAWHLAIGWAAAGGWLALTLASAWVRLLDSLRRPERRRLS